MRENNLSESDLIVPTAAKALLETVTTTQTRCRTSRAAFLPQLFWASLLASSLLLVGLTVQAQDASKQQNQVLSQESGFLGDNYSKLQPDPENSDLLSYWKDKDVLKNSSKFILDPVVI